MRPPPTTPPVVAGFTGVAPPLVARRRAAIGEQHANVVLQLFDRMEWVGPQRGYRTRRMAVHQATRLAGLLKRLEPGSTFNKRTWQDRDKWRWAIRRAP